MKKYLMMVLVVMMVALALCGCGASGGNGEDTSQAEDVSVLTKAQVEQMYTDADPFKGSKVTLTGCIFNTPERDDKGAYFQMYCDPEEMEDSVVVHVEGSNEALKDKEFVEVAGIVKGTFKGENAFGAKLEYPLIEASSVKPIDAQEVISPTLKAIEPGASVTQGGCTVTVEKVEFAEKVTRVYVQAQNGSNATVSLNTYSEVAVQNGKQMDATFNESMYLEYPELPYELRAGASAEGVVLFPAMEQADFEFVMTGYDDVNYSELEFAIPVAVGE